MPSLQNRIIAITRSMHEAEEFFQLVNAEGGRALAMPAIEIVPASAKIANQFIASLEKKNYEYCAFMSAQAVSVLFELAGGAKEALEKTSVIAVGPKTKQALEKRGVKVQMIPDKFSSIGLVELLSRSDVGGKRIIIPRSSEANDFALKGLIGLGMKVDELFLYRTRPAKITSEWEKFGELIMHNKVDGIIFTSASNVRALFKIMEKMRKNIPNSVKMISIGPFTTQELEKAGVACYEAKDHTIRGTVDIAKEILSQA